MARKDTPSVDENDPLAAALKPPEGETESEKLVRLQKEAEAKRVSEKIDEEIKAERQRLAKSKGDVKLLLLGQAESGKSTLLKQFQLMYNPTALDTERASWRTVIFFNIIRTLNQILNTLAELGDIDDGTDANSIAERLDTELLIDDDDMSVSSVMDISMSKKRAGKQTAFHTTPYTSRPQPPISASAVATQRASLSSASQIAQLRMRLSPMRGTEEALGQRLSGGVPLSDSKGEVLVRAGWQTRATENGSLAASGGRSRRTKRSVDIGNSGLSDDHDALLDDVAVMLENSKGDIKALWEHPLVVALIARRKLKLDEWSEFFLNDIGRIASTGYLPTTDDILHARIASMGVAEHTFDVDLHGRVAHWRLYDVGGARGQRHTWVPYFDTSNAIIFVAPISAFDQYLEEDIRTNRIEDSLQLFTQICANPLLKKVHLVLFLNKTDLLRNKLKRGLQVNKYILSFGDRPNDYESVVQYFRSHFLQVHRRNNENRRVLYTHLTSVVDTKTTQSIIANVRDSIFRGYLQSAALV